MTKLRAIALALFVAGFTASYALAGNGHGHGKTSDTTSTGTSTAAVTTTTAGHGHKAAKVALCHKAGKSGRYVKIEVAAKAAKAHLRHGDVAPAADGSCPAPAAPSTTDTTTNP